MGTSYASLDQRLRAFIDEQPVFFVATAPLSGDADLPDETEGAVGSDPASAD